MSVTGRSPKRQRLGGRVGPLRARRAGAKSVTCPRQRALGRRGDLLWRDLPQAPEVARCAHALVARTAGQRPGLHRFGDQQGIAPGLRPQAQRRTVDPHDRRAGGGGEMQRPAVAADVERGASDEDAEVSQTKLLGQHHASGGLFPEGLACGLCDPGDRFGVRRAGREQDAASGRAAGERCRQVGERFSGPAAEGVACAHVDDDQLSRVRHASRGKHSFHALTGVGRFRHLRRIVEGVERRYAQWREQIRLVRHRVSRPQLARAVHPVGVHPAAAGDCVADPARCPGHPRQPRAARAAVKIDDQVEAPGAQRTRKA